MLPIERLRESSASALKFRDLICIAAYSTSPSTAYNVAYELEWWHKKAISCRYLAVILREYGLKEFKKMIAKEAPKAYRSICFCKCHIGQLELDNIGDPMDEYEDCNCDCCDHEDCFHAAHTFNYACDYCDYEDDNYDYDDSDYDYDCDSNGYSGYYGEYGGHSDDPSEVKKEVTEKENREERIIKKLKEVSGLEFNIEKVKEIDGNSIQAIADGKNKVIKVTEKLIQELNDDEFAWIIAHEIAHIEDEHGKKSEELSDELGDQLKKQLETVDHSLKESGKGFFTRVTALAITGAVGGAAMLLKILSESREHEKEADSKAVELVKEAGFNPEAGIGALKKLSGVSLYQHTLLGSLSATHPDSVSRAEKISKYKNKK